VTFKTYQTSPPGDILIDQKSPARIYFAPPGLNPWGDIRAWRPVKHRRGESFSTSKPPPLQGGGVFNLTAPLPGDILDEQKLPVCHQSFVPVGLTLRGHT